MGLKVFWTPDAERSFGNVIDFILIKWTGKEVKKFTSATKKTIQQISKNPEMFVSSRHEKIRKAVITKHNSLYYRVEKNSVHLLIFWDNRKNPEYNIYK
ncbi:MAG: type II toxin-antitoxin system RelE/ParE family toxin [Flavobacteriales bacterium]